MGFLIKIIFIIIILTGFAFINYYLGRHHFVLQFKKREYPIRQGRIQLITNGTNLFITYFQDLKKAKSTIQVQFYIVKDDALSQAFFKILKEQADRGIKVQPPSRLPWKLEGSSHPSRLPWKLEGSSQLDQGSQTTWH